MRNIEIPVRQFVFSKNRHFLIIPFLGLLFDQVNVLNNPERSALMNIQKQGVLHYLKYFFLQLYLFELISFFILAILIKYYYRWLKLYTIKPGLKDLLRYELKWFPLFALSIFVFGPVTNFFRYLFLLYPANGWTSYFPDFFMSVSMYFNYFIPIMIWGYIIVNINLVLSYLKRNNLPSENPEPVQHPSTKTELLSTKIYLTVIEGNTLKGGTILSTPEILWFEVQNKSYYAITADETYAVKKTIAELEKELNPNLFFRINRSQIININAILSYNYWEFEKYVIRLKNISDKDFVITRKRFKELKTILEKAKQN